MDTESLPQFRYHPDPVRTGSIVASDTECVCCGVSRGYVYAPSPFAEDDLEGQLCPWCIADGAAAATYDAEFNDSHGLKREGISEDVIDEIIHRTPGYIAWQDPRWLSHCGDACEFHGDLPAEKLPNVSETARAEILADLSTDMTWQRILDEYEPGDQPAIYWFKCRHCGMDRYYADYS
jgi:uncharacterized protein